MKLVDQETVWSKDGYRYTISTYEHKTDRFRRSVVEVDREVYHDKLGCYTDKQVVWREERQMNVTA